MTRIGEVPTACLLEFQVYSTFLEAAMKRGAPKPINELQRLQRLSELCVVESDLDEVFERVVAMTALYYEAPISLISIVDQHRQWFRAKVGIDATQTPRDLSFCGYAILANEPMEILDATQDERFKDNPLVTGPPYIRYYAGAPLLTDDGLALGSLCIIDNHPRPPMSVRDRSILKHFAELVMQRIQGLRSRSFVDQPTGLFNRLRLEEDVRHSQVNNLGSQLFAVDMLSPKFLNDVVKALGYSFSQQLILAIKSRLQALLPAGCVLYKISPTRFGFIVPGDAPTEALCKQILENFKLPVECQGIPVQMQVGLGVLPIDSAQGDQDWLRLAVSAADDARDRNVGWARYEPKFDAAQRRAFTLLSSLSEAVRASDQLHLMFQPQVDLLTGTCRSVEALLRWNHPLLGPISPAEFIPLVEKTALVRPLSLWVLDAVIRQSAAWRDVGVNLRMSMNVTVNDLEDPTFVDQLLKSAQLQQIPPQQLEIEFTESVLMDNPLQVQRQLERVRDAGMAVAIDDFGTGYSNWNYFSQLPVTTVKLDQSLMKKLVTDAKDQRLVQTLIEFAQRLGYRVVAEGVENQSTLDLIQQWGCTEVQGYLFAKPMTASALTDWLNSRRTG